MKIGINIITFLNICSGIIFPSPLSSTKGWHPVGFEHTMYNNVPKRVEFIDENYVLWKGKDEYHMRPDVCPHQGAKLSKGTIEDNCIKCSYHGLKIGPYKEAHKDKHSKEVHGICKTHQGIIWWSNDKKESTEVIPHCEKFAENPNIPMTRFSIDLEAGFSDCFKNSMDFHHAAWVHKNTFGNYAGEPDLVAERWNTKGELEGNFLYGSNQVYAQYTGGETDNSHVYCEPSTTYNIVNGKDGKFMVIHVAMRSISKYKTKWYVTAASNFVPSGPIGTAILYNMARKVAIEEDGKQLANMATDEEKEKHAFRFTLPLDTIYAGWNKKYETAEQLEELLSKETDKNKMALIGEKLRVYNNTVDFYPLIQNTEWEMFNCPHLFPGCTIYEIFRNKSASEITQLKNGTVFSVVGRMHKQSNDIVLINRLVAKVQHTKDKPKVPVFNPFTKHAFKAMYISDKFFLRKGVETDNWEMMKRIPSTSLSKNCLNDNCTTPDKPIQSSGYCNKCDEKYSDEDKNCYNFDFRGKI